jgi:hypothetical protein
MKRIIKTYEQFAPNPLALPPHKEENEQVESKMTFFLKTLYEMEREDIVTLANKFISWISNGYYLKVKHLDSKTELIRHNEPCEIIGATKGATVYGIDIPEDSIIINVKHEESMFILSVKDNYQITFVKPRVMISAHDPYGEEDWEDKLEYD